MPDNDSNRATIERPAPRHFRIFLSSPGDVWEERDLARKLIKEKLPYRPFLRDRVTFDVVSWDDPHARTPMVGTLTPQECVNRFGPKPSDCNIFVVLFWARMGTPLPETYRKASGERYLSGTEWEYEDAFNAGSLDLLIYRRTGVPLLRYGDPERVEKQRQLDLVEQFFQKFCAADGSLLRLFTAYEEPSDFEKLLADDLERILRLHLDADDAKRALGLWQREEELAERERVLHDREAAVDALVAEAKTPESSVAIETALQELTAGNATRAKAVFAEVMDRKAAESSAAAGEAAAAARHLGTLAILDDTLEALRAFRRASELDPTDTWTWIHISRLETQKGGPEGRGSSCPPGTPGSRADRQRARCCGRRS